MSELIFRPFNRTAFLEKSGRSSGRYPTNFIAGPLRNDGIYGKDLGDFAKALIKIEPEGYQVFVGADDSENIYKLGMRSIKDPSRVLVYDVVANTVTFPQRVARSEMYMALYLAQHVAGWDDVLITGNRTEIDDITIPLCYFRYVTDKAYAMCQGQHGVMAPYFRGRSFAARLDAFTIFTEDAHILQFHEKQRANHVALNDETFMAFDKRLQRLDTRFSAERLTSAMKNTGKLMLERASDVVPERAVRFVQDTINQFRLK